jgi:hypothetical protein
MQTKIRAFTRYITQPERRLMHDKSRKGIGPTICNAARYRRPLKRGRWFLSVLVAAEELLDESVLRGARANGFGSMESAERFARSERPPTKNVDVASLMKDFLLDDEQPFQTPRGSARRSWWTTMTHASTPDSLLAGRRSKTFY